jgi:hypothetical protein
MHVPSPAALRHPSNISNGRASSCRLSTVKLLLSSGSFERSRAKGSSLASGEPVARS